MQLKKINKKTMRNKKIAMKRIRTKFDIKINEIKFQGKNQIKLNIQE